MYGRRKKMKKNAQILVIVTSLLMLLGSTSNALNAQRSPLEKHYWRELTNNPFPPLSHFNFAGPEFQQNIPERFLLDNVAYYWSNGTYTPAVGTSWEYNEYSTDPYEATFTIHFRDDVIWHDGTRFTSFDFKLFFVIVWLSEGFESPCPWLAEDMAGDYQNWLDTMETPDDSTIIFHMSSIWPYYERAFLRARPITSYGGIQCPYSQFGQFYERLLPILETGDTTALESLRDDLLAYRPERILGTGPFMYVSHTDTVLTMERFEDWWGKKVFGDVIKYDGVKIYYVESADVGLGMFLSGEIDTIGHPYLTPEAWDTIVADRETYWWADPIVIQCDPEYAIGTFGHYINPYVYPGSLPVVREAIAYAYNKSFYCSVQEPAMSPEGYVLDKVPNIPYQTATMKSRAFVDDEWLSRLKVYSYDPAKARAVLDAAEIIDRDGDGIRETSNGTKLEFDMLTVTDWGVNFIEAPEYVKACLAEVGIKLNVVALPFSVGFPELSNPETRDRYTMGWVAGWWVGPWDIYSSINIWTEGSREWGTRNVIMFPEAEAAGIPEMINVPDWVLTDLGISGGLYNITHVNIEIQTALDPIELAKCMRIIAWYQNEYVHIYPTWLDLYKRFVVNTKDNSGFTSPDNPDAWGGWGGGIQFRTAPEMIWFGLRPNIADNIPPEVTLTTPTSGATITQTARPLISVKITDIGTGVDSTTITMTLDDSTMEPTFNPTTGELSYTPPSDLSEGYHEVSIAVKDTSDNEKSMTFGFNIQTVQPPSPGIATEIVAVAVIASLLIGAIIAYFVMRIRK